MRALITLKPRSRTTRDQSKELVMTFRISATQELARPLQPAPRPGGLLSAVALLLAAVLSGPQVRAWAQSETTGAMAGQVSDPSGAPLPGAEVTVASSTTGLRRTVQTDESGRFSFPDLKPGPYRVEAKAQGFEDQTIGPLSVPLGQTQTVNVVLKLTIQKTAVEVQSVAPLINTENPNTATTLEATAIADLPNAGSDMTYVAQFSPGALINTAGSSNDFVGGQNGTATWNSMGCRHCRTPSSWTDWKPTTR